MHVQICLQYHKIFSILKKFQFRNIFWRGILSFHMTIYGYPKNVRYFHHTTLYKYILLCTFWFLVTSIKPVFPHIKTCEGILSLPKTSAWRLRGIENFFASRRGRHANPVFKNVALFMEGVVLYKLNV